MKLRLLTVVLALGLGASFALKQATARPNMLICEAMPRVLSDLHDSHIEFRKPTKLVDERTVQGMLEYLDPSRTLLTVPEAEAVEDRLRQAVRQVRKGQCSELDALHQDHIAWMAAREAWVDKTVSKKNFKVDTTVELILDPDERERPANAAEREELWRQLVHFQAAQYLARGMELSEAKERLIHKYELWTKRVEELESSEVYDVYLDSVAAAMDPHTTYFSPMDLEDFEISMKLSLEGIGAVLTTDDGFTVVREVVAGGAADRNGKLKAQDRIVAVAQGGEEPVDVVDMALRHVVQKIRGKKGTPVTLSILRDMPDGGVENMDITIVRDAIKLEDDAASLRVETREVGDKTVRLGVLDLPSFYGGSDKDASNSDDDVLRLLNEAQSEELDGLVLDLSQNGGGLLEHAIRISGYFIGTGPVVGVAGSGRARSYDDKDPDVQWDKPLVVLTSRASASASEIVAGAVKDHRRAVLVGDPSTFGKGSVQQMQGLPMELGAIKVTTDLFFRPNGTTNQNTGVPADVVVRSPWDQPHVGEATLPNPLPPRTIDPLEGGTPNPEGKGHWNEVTAEMIEILARNSADRVAANEDLQELFAQLDEAANRTAVVKVAELLEKDDDETAVEEAAEVAEDAPKDPASSGEADEIPMSPQLEEALNVLADLVELQRAEG